MCTKRSSHSVLKYLILIGQFVTFTFWRQRNDFLYICYDYTLQTHLQAFWIMVRDVAKSKIAPMLTPPCLLLLM